MLNYQKWIMRSCFSFYQNLKQKYNRITRTNYDQLDIDTLFYIYT